MTKKHFIALADAIRDYNQSADCASQFYTPQIAAIADFCGQQNDRFDRERWLGYIAGTNGKNGGQIK